MEQVAHDSTNVEMDAHVQEDVGSMEIKDSKISID